MRELETVHYSCEVEDILNNEHLFVSEIVKSMSDEVYDKLNKGKDTDYECGEITDVVFENVGFQLYFTDKDITLEEAQDFLVLDVMGLLEGKESWYGYSSWTISGWQVDDFTVGGHDILNILNSHRNEFVHFVITFYDEY